MKHDKSDRITIRFDPVIGRKIRALAQQRGLSVADYCRTMCMLEVLNEPPERPFTLVQQQLKETLVDVETFGQLDPQDQVDVIRRSLDAVTTVKKAADKAFTWLYAVARASDALTKNQKGDRVNARPGNAGDPDTPDDD
jgi:hypothetical protein